MIALDGRGGQHCKVSTGPDCYDVLCTVNLGRRRLKSVLIGLEMTADGNMKHMGLMCGVAPLDLEFLALSVYMKSPLDLELHPWRMKSRPATEKVLKRSRTVEGSFSH